MGARPLRRSEKAEAVLSVFAVRATIELERRSEEALLRQEKDFFARIVQTLPGFLALIDPDGRVRLANEELLRAAGRSQEQVVGRDFLAAFVPEEERPALAAGLGTLTGGVESVRLESLLLTGDGGRLPVTWQLRARLTPEGAPDYRIAIGTAACEAPQREGMP